MKTLHCSLLVIPTALAAFGQAPPTVRIPDEIAPPGGIAQIKVQVTSPMPILTGFADFDLSQVSFASVDGINLFNPNGDVAGAAVINGTTLGVRFISPQGTFGTNVDYPLLTAAIR